MKFYDFLKSRHLIEASTCDEAQMSAFLETPQTVYVGFDPTASCLQAGNYVAIQLLAQFQRAGHHVIAVVGGATGMIGDPSGRSTERNFLSIEQLQKNLEGIKENLSRFLDFNHPTNPALLLNNYDWYKDYALLPFLRDVGTLFRMNPMLAKDSVQKRLNAETNSMTFTEFCYQILQGYDFYYLNKHYGCTLQMGGSDQWGNITAGTDLIHRASGPDAVANGLTIPLVCDANGQKFGKSAGNAIFLNADKTSIYDFYQFFLRTLDADVIRYLHIFTFLDEARIAELATQLQANPEKHEAQRVLAEELTRTVHGEAGLATAQKASTVLFGGSIEGLSAVELESIFSDIPSAELSRAEIVEHPLVDVVVAAQFMKSKGEARRLLQGGGLSLNNVKVDDPARSILPSDFVDQRLLLIRQGKKNYFLL
ncbi:MAG: tyrosine--tRNA ligase, partial [Kiritimatiellia bacterium]